MCNSPSCNYNRVHSVTVIPYEGIISRLQGLCKHELLNSIYNEGNSEIQVMSKGVFIAQFVSHHDAADYVCGFGENHPRRDIVIVPRKKRNDVRH